MVSKKPKHIYSQSELKSLLDLPALSSTQQTSLLKKMVVHRKTNNRKMAMRLRNRLVVANIRLVAHIAKRFTHSKQDYEDLFSEGLSGLTKALDRFDPKFNTKLSTYAIPWIRKHILLSIRQNSNLIRRPQRYNYNKDEDGNTSEVCLFSDISENYNPNSHKIHDNSLGNLIKKESIRHLRLAIPKTLNKRNANIIRLRFGLDLEEPMSLQKVATRMKLSKERVRQLEVHSLKRLHKAITSKRCVTITRLKI